ncbi:MAG: hypothetical protein ACFFGZ_14335 [Candidatus Thorarchaeota archaeon]
MSTLLSFLLDEPILLSIIILGLLVMDTFLAQVSLSVLSREYSKFFQTKKLEIYVYDKKKLLKHLNLTINAVLRRMVLGVIFGAGLYLFSSANQEVYEIVAGAVFLTLTGFLLIRCRNIYNGWYLIQHPTTLSGKIRISTAYQFALNRALYGTFAVVWLLVFVFVNQLFFLGGSFGALFIIFATFWYEARQKKLVQEFAEQKPEVPEAPPPTAAPAFCPECGFRPPSGAAFSFCPNCGSKIQ